MIFDNRVEIVSPGGLPKGVSIESIQFGKTCQRNSLMASFCAKTMEYRGLGTGILRAVKEEQGNTHFENEEDSQFKVVIDRERCKGCELCKSFCPKQIIEMDTQVNAKGYCPAKITEQAQCIGCQSCATVCPDCAIEIYQLEEGEA
jgi:2-oxoglutarate ferredoxin oxidoreductase subunit delta